ncbi:unnamed protein product, partial [Oppiella nova]
SNFINGVWDLLVYFKDDPLIVNSLNRIVHTLTELLKYDTILIDQANRTVGKNMSALVRDDIFKAKETKRHFDKISDDYDSVLNRHSQIPRTKPTECEEAANLLMATRSCFQHLTLDYVTQLSVFKSKKRHEVLDSLLSLMHAYGTYYHQGSDLFQDFDPIKKDTASQTQSVVMDKNNNCFSYLNILLKIIDMRNGTSVLEKQLEGRHTLVAAKESVPALIKGDTIRLEGYLFKRTSNAFKTWNRRWFIIQDHQLVYQKRSHERDVTVMEEDLRLCTAKPVQFMERRFCFEVLSPSKSHILQADSEEACQAWISAMQAGIDAAYNCNNNDNTTTSGDIQSLDSQDSWCTASSTSSASKSSTSINNLTAGGNGATGAQSGSKPPAKPPRVTYAQILAIPGNEFCCDCRSPDPKWASINIGITLCIECSGIHRSLGVHLSKVRSLNLDAWDLELIKVMSALGNAIINTSYEAKVDESVARRATPDCDRTQRELWIKAKYVKKAFVDKSDDKPDHKHLSTDCDQKTIASDVVMISDNKGTDDQNNSNESHNRSNSNENIVQISDAITSSDTNADTLGQMCDKSGAEEVVTTKTSHEESGSEEDEDSEETQLIVTTSGDNKPKTSAQKCDTNSQNNKNHSNVSPPSEAPVVCAQSSSSSVSTGNCPLNTTPNSDNKYYNLMLYNAAIDSDLKTMSEGLAKGATINWHNTDDQNRTPLHQAIMSDAVTGCEYLLLNGAKSNVSDDNGTTPLHLATQRGNTGYSIKGTGGQGLSLMCVCLLLKRGADQLCTDKDGHNALSIAINNANADIVTLLRLAKLNDEMKNDEEFGNISDETFNEVVRDFTQLASQSPEKLRRNTTHNPQSNQSNTTS